MAFVWKENYTSILTVILLLISVIVLGITVYKAYNKKQSESTEPEYYRNIADIAAAGGEYYRYLDDELK